MVNSPLHFPPKVGNEAVVMERSPQKCMPALVPSHYYHLDSQKAASAEEKNRLPGVGMIFIPSKYRAKLSCGTKRRQAKRRRHPVESSLPRHEPKWFPHCNSHMRQG